MDFNNDSGTLSNVSIISASTSNLTLTNTGALVLPTGDTSQRPTFANGLLRYNSQTGYVEAASGSRWINITASVASPATSIYVSTSGDDTLGDGSAGNPYRTVKKGATQAALIATSVAPVTVSMLEGIYDEVNPITLSNAYVKLAGGDTTRTVIKPTVNGSPLLILSSSVAGAGPSISSLTFTGDATYKATSGGSLIQVSGNGVYSLDGVVLRSGNIGVEAGVGTITTLQEIIWEGATIGNAIGAVSRSTVVLAMQFYMALGDTIAIQANDTSEIQLGTYNIQGAMASPSKTGTGIQVNNSAHIFATNGVITRTTLGLQANNTSTCNFVAADFIDNTTDFSQASATATIQIQGAISKTKQLITAGGLVSLNYTDTDTGDFIVGAALATGTPGKEFRIRVKDGRVAIGDHSANENITAGGVGGSRSVNIIDSNGNLRLWRYTNDPAQDPSMEWIKGINSSNDDGVGDAPIVSITSATRTFVIDVSSTDYNGAFDATPGIDRTTLAARAFPAGRLFQINGTVANNGTYTVSSATYNSGPQTISVVATTAVPANAGAVGTMVFGGGAGRTDGPNPGNATAAVAAGTGNVWWDMFMQESDYLVFRHRTGGGGSAINEKVRIYSDRSEWLGASTYGDTDNALITTLQHNTNAVNSLTIKNSAATLPLTLQAVGTDGNISINMLPKGTGTLTVIGTTNYATNVINNDDIPNKLYVDNKVASSVTSVGLIAPAEFSVTGSPVTTTGNLTLTKATQVKNTVYAGPTAGANAQPTFRTIGLNQNDVSDVTVVTPVAGQMLQWNGSAWVNGGTAPGSITGTIAAAQWVLLSGSRYYFDFPHNLGTQNIHVQLYDTTTNAMVVPDQVIATNVSTVRIVVVGNTKTLRIVVIANGVSVGIMNGGGVPVIIEDLYANRPAANTVGRLFIAYDSKVFYRDNGTSWDIVSASSGTVKSYTFYANSLDSPTTADFVVNALAPVISDPTNTAMNVRAFSNTVEQGVGLMCPVPLGATIITFKIRGKPTTAPGASTTVTHKIYSRQIPNNAAMGAWSVATSFTALTIPTNAYYQNYTQSFPLVTLGLSVNNSYHFELTRAIGGLASAWLVLEVVVEFT